MKFFLLLDTTEKKGNRRAPIPWLWIVLCLILAFGLWFATDRLQIGVHYQFSAVVDADITTDADLKIETKNERAVEVVPRKERGE